MEENEKMRVLLQDGRDFVGDLVIGADSVHSKVREIMWDMANTKNPGIITAEEKHGKYCIPHRQSSREVITKSSP